MVLSSRVLPAAAALSLGCLLLAHLPLAEAQGRPESGVVGFVISCPFALVEVNLNSVASTICEFTDLTRDSGPPIAGAPTVGTVPHTTTIEPRGTIPPNATGWQAQLSRNFIGSNGGETVPITIDVKTLPNIDVADVAFVFEAIYSGPNNLRSNQTFIVAAQVNPFDEAIVNIQARDIVQRAGQDEVVQYEVVVKNDGVYPDIYRFDVRVEGGALATTPPNLYVPPGETRSTNVSILTPKGKLYELGKNVAVKIVVSSTTGSGVYFNTGVLTIRGPHVPVYYWPLFAVMFLSAMVVTRKTREKLETRRLELGRPRRVQLTPRQAVLLAALRKGDPEGYKQKKAALAAVYKKRREAYKAAHREQVANDREERRQAKVEFREQKKRQAEERKAAKAAKVAERAAAKAQAKVNKKAAKIDAKEVKKKEKVLAKKRAKLEKARAKAERAEAKEAMKRAKEDAKAAKAAKKAAKKAR